jgi:acetyl-CoA carboxylase carboxyltransferase component
MPVNGGKPFDMMEVVGVLADRESWLELKALYAKELLTGLCRIEGRTVGVVANQPKHLGGVLFAESANKAARFIQLCDAYGIPLVYLADVPGFMIGSKVERQGIIRAGAKMIAAMSMATVPKISVIVRKAYGAGLYAMCGPAFEPDACIALPTASVGVMGPQAAVNAVYYNKIHELPVGAEREAFIAERRAAYQQDINLYKLADDLVIDAVVPPEQLRSQVASRLSLLLDKQERRLPKKRAILPM